MKIAAISCARMESTRLPGKCLLSLNGQPLIQYTIDFAILKLQIPLYIWTRDIEIMECVKSQCPIIYEPFSLYDKINNKNHNWTYEQMKFANQIIDADYLILLQPTHPIRDVEKIKKWINSFINIEQVGYGYSSLGGNNYNVNGLFYIYSKKYLQNKTGDVVFWPDEKCFDIDTKEDLEACEKWMKEKCART